MNEIEWIDKLRHSASVAEVDAEVYRQQMVRAKKMMDAALQHRDDLLNAVSDVMAAKEKATALDG